MAKNLRGSGDTIDFPGIIENNTTITAGVMVWSTGTALAIAPLTAILATATLEAANFLGVMENTQTGTSVNGHMTGATIHRKGVFEFNTLALNTGINILVGQPVWGAGPRLVRGQTTTAGTITGILPIGMCVWLNEPDASTVSVRCHVDIFPNDIRMVPAESGAAEI